MEKFSLLFPPVKHHIHPTSTTTHEPHTSSSTHNSSSSAARRSKPPQPPLFVPPGYVVFRLLCHASRVGGLIGKSGSVIKHLQQLTSSRIRVEDPTEGGDHQVISVVSSPDITNRVRVSASAPKDGEGTDGGADDGDEWFDVSAAQEGVLRVFERLVEVAAEVDAAAGHGGVVSCRLLVSKNQGGAVIGKGGMVVEKIKKDTGCKIQVLNSEKFSSGSVATDEIVEIEGNILSVKKALVFVTGRIQEFPPIGRTRTYGTGPLETESLTIQNGDLPVQQRPIVQPMLSHPTTPQQEVVFKILCPNEKVGGIIGKGGFVVKAIKNKTGASISIGPPVAECDEQMITIAATESAESHYSPAQNAAILVFNRSMEAGLVKGSDSDSRGSPVSARILVPSNQVGCLLGKGGAIISEMRKATSTGLRLIGGNQVPKCASENVEVLQITGELANVQDALFKVTGRLRDHLFSNLISNGRGDCNSLRTEDNVYGKVKDPLPSGSHLSVCISDNLNEENPLAQSMDHLRISINIDRPSSPSLLASQKVSEVSQGNIMDNGGGLSSVKGGVEIGSGNQSVTVANMTVEIVVHDTVIGSIYGENGSNLARLRQISGAKVIVQEPRPGTDVRIIVISGTPDETQVAQSLLQAFILDGSS